MLKKQIFLSILLGCAALSVFSCKSEPEPVAEEPAGPDVSVPDVAEPSVIDEELTALRNEVTQLRNSLIDFGFDKVDSVIWNEADTAFQSAESSFGKNSETARSGYLSAKESYDKLMTLGLSGLSGKMATARKDAVDSGASDRFPEEFAAVKNKESAVSIDDPQKAVAEASSVLDGYNAMSTYMLADSLKKRIQDLNLVPVDGASPSAYTEDFNAGCEAMTAVEGSLMTDPTVALTSARIAVDKFNVVLDAWFKKCADEKIAALNQLVAQCDAIKASVAVKVAYTEAVNVRGKAQQLYNGNSYEAALTAFTESVGLFEMVYGQAVIKRDAAIQAMENAKKQQETASSLAVVADENAPLVGDDEPEIPLPDTESSDAEEPVTAVEEPVTANDEPVTTGEPKEPETTEESAATEEIQENESDAVEPVTANDEPVVIEEVTDNELVSSDVSDNQGADE